MEKIGLQDLDGALSDQELQEIEAAERKAPVFDEDSPEMTAEMLLQFKRVRISRF